MKIVVLDGYVLNPGDLSWAGFEALGDFICYDRTPPELTVSRIADAQAVIVNKTVISRAVLAACPDIRYVGVLATGYNVVDTEAARERGVVVTNVPAYSTDAVAQFVFALLLEVCHHVGEHARGVAAGEWAASPDFCYWKYPLIELSGQTLGILGFGQIGRRVAPIARALGMNVRVHTPHPDGAGEGVEFVTLDELLGQSDVITLHMPLFPATKGIINEQSIGKMKDGVIVLNTARGPLVDDLAMAQALARGKVGWYAADVAATEPIAADNPLLSAPRCILTPHIAWAPLSARRRLVDWAAGNLAAFLAGKPVNVVNG